MRFAVLFMLESIALDHLCPNLEQDAMESREILTKLATSLKDK
jgi:hypothetical protein